MPRRRPRLNGTSMLHIDAANGFAFPAIEPGNSTVGSAVRQDRNSRSRPHPVPSLRAAWCPCGTFGRGAGCVAVMFANSPKAMAPWGGNAPSIWHQSNCLCHPAPRGSAATGYRPVTVESCTRQGYGGGQSRQRHTRRLGSECLGRSDHRPPRLRLPALWCPPGDAKGAALALMVEILSATLTGAIPQL